MKSLILLVSAGNVQRGLVCGALGFLQKKCSIRCTEQTICARDHIEHIVRFLLASVMHQDQTQSAAIGKAFQPGNDIVVAGVAVRFAADLTNLLQGIDDNEPGIRVLANKTLQLLVQSFPKLSRSCSKKELIRDFHIEHLIHPALETLVIILQRQIQNRSLPHRVIPERCPGTDMVGELRDQETLSQLRRADQKIGSGIEQAVDQRRLALIRGFIQLSH